ncbi:hypothetical protein [Oricola sp.]|uniref:hypothetical protein n=1 Tax=Oricola sp. TaxID=1979950 RepID=UPI003BAAA0F2
MPPDIEFGLTIDDFGRVIVTIDPPGAAVTFEFTPLEMRTMAEKLLHAAMQADATVTPVVEAALAKAGGQIH